MELRRLLKLGGIVGFCIALAGCVLSVNPVVAEADVTYDARLIGNWEHMSDSDRAVISLATDNTYAIEYTDGKKAGRFNARLGKLEGHLLLDVWPAPQEKDQGGPDAGLRIPGHLLFVVDIGEDQISMTALEPDPLLESIRAGDVRAAYRQNEDRLILTDTTEELRSALGPYLATSGALSEPSIWRRATGKQNETRPVDVPCFESAAWREADQLFHRDPHWLGGDVASSVDLGGERTLWLFGDSWIDLSGSGDRKQAHMVSNSVAIQTGANPSTATIAFYWGSTVDGHPTAMFPDSDGESLWFGNGVRVDDRLVLFFSRTLRGTGTGLGFQSVGWTAIMVENPDARPSQWRMRPVDTTANPLGIAVGFAAAFKLGDWVYALGSQDPVKSHPLFAARWPAEHVRRGTLLETEWWAGKRLGWVAESSDSPRWPLFENGQSELTIHFDQSTQRFLSVHSKGFGRADVVMRASPSLTGPWSAPRVLYRPPEYYQRNIMIYAAKAHPQLSGGDLLVTYATNTFEFGEHLTNSKMYYPHFVRLTRCE